MRYPVLRGFSLGNGVDAQPEDGPIEIPERVAHLVPLWQRQGKLGAVVSGTACMIHKGGGKWNVLDAEGKIVKSGGKKAEAEKEVAWLQSEEE